MKAPAWIWNRLAVSGDADTFHDFTTAAQGPGFIEWGWPNFAAATEHLPLSCRGALRTALERTHDGMREAAHKDPRRCKLDFNALVPVPDEIRRRGFDPHGRAWCLEHWGVEYPLDRLNFLLTERKIRHSTRARGRGRLVTVTAPQIVYEFYTRDRSPWPIVAAICRRWPALEVQLHPYPLQTLVSVRFSASEIRVKTPQRQRDRSETVNAVYGRKGGSPSSRILPKSFLNEAQPSGRKGLTPWDSWRPLGDSNPCYRRERAMS